MATHSLQIATRPAPTTVNQTVLARYQNTLRESRYDYVIAKYRLDEWIVDRWLNEAPMVKLSFP